MPTLILDDFTGTSGTDLNGRTPDTTDVPGSTWSLILGSIQILITSVSQAFVAAQAANGWMDGFFGNNANTALYTIDAGVSDCTIKLSNFAVYGAIVYRYQDANNLSFVASSGGTAYLFEVVGGTNNNVASVAIANDNTLKLVCSGTSIQYGSNALEGSYTSSSSGSGRTKVGLMQIFLSSGTFRSYEVDGSGGGTAYTLSAAVGSFALTGEPSAEKAGRPFAGSAGSFVLTGIAAALPRGHPLSASAGAFVLTGEPLVPKVSRPFSAAVGSFIVTGATASILAGKQLLGTSGTFTLTGKTASLLKALHLSVDAGAFTLTGKSAVMIGGKQLLATPGTFTLTGVNASLTSARTLAAVAGSFAVTGHTAIVSAGHPLSATAGSFTLSGKTLNATTSRILSAGVGTFIVTGQAAQLVASGVILVSAVIHMPVNFTYVQDARPQFERVRVQAPKFAGG